MVIVVVICPTIVKGREVELVLAVLAVEALGLILMSFLYNVTAIVGGEPHSLALMLLTVLIGGANVVSSPVFLPIMTQYPISFSSAFAAGEAFSSLLTALLALIQYTTGFSVGAYFCILAGFVVCSTASYLALRFLPASKALRDSCANAVTLQEAESTGLVNSVGSSRRHTVGLIWTDLIVTIALNWMESGALVAVLSYCLLP
jgi:hypothetical protein